MENKITPEQEWQWCLVGNIAEKHEYGEEHEMKYGNKQFRPNAKVYINLIYGGMGHEHILVIGIPRHSSDYIEIVTARKNVYNFRVQKVFKPAVLKKMKNWRRRSMRPETDGATSPTCTRILLVTTRARPGSLPLKTREILQGASPTGSGSFPRTI